MLVIVLFILILNIVSIFLMYKCLTGIDKKEKLVFIAAGVAIMYVLTSIIYWISTRSIEITEVSNLGKDLIIFAFVPVNSIIVLPIFAKSFSKYREGRIDNRILRNRGILLGIILIILLVIECIYFKNIQEQVVNLIKDKESIEAEQQEDNLNVNVLEDIDNNLNTIDTDSLNNTENQIEVEVVNDVDNENSLDTNTENTSNIVDNVTNATE